ncbi:homeobox protein Mohawk-like isoform 2-T2 [Synchiropus picturatus]
MFCRLLSASSASACDWTVGGPMVGGAAGRTRNKLLDFTEPLDSQDGLTSTPQTADALVPRRTNPVTMMTSDDLLHLKDNIRAETARRSYYDDLTQASLAEAPDTDLLHCQDTSESSAFKCRRYGSRLGGVKVRHKRQVLQDMARPLKHWLYKHRDNPYPTKTEKVLLALGSHMTLVQVSNWFANARRRLKNTVRQPDLSWALRIKLYNKYIQGNAERLSVCSDTAESEDEECALRTPLCQTDFGRSSPHKLNAQSAVLTVAGSANSDDSSAPPSKYKSSLLNRYLNDTLRHMMAAKPDAVTSARTRTHSESFSSNECERDVVSPASSNDTEANFVYQMVGNASKYHSDQQQRRDPEGWREINAAVALADLAQGNSGVTVALTPSTERKCSRQLIPLKGTKAGDRIHRDRHVTSRIIQKSSHIAEVQTVCSSPV